MSVAPAFAPSLSGRGTQPRASFCASHRVHGSRACCAAARGSGWKRVRSAAERAGPCAHRACRQRLWRSHGCSCAQRHRHSAPGRTQADARRVACQLRQVVSSSVARYVSCPCRGAPVSPCTSLAAAGANRELRAMSAPLQRQLRTQSDARARPRRVLSRRGMASQPVEAALRPQVRRRAPACAFSRAAAARPCSVQVPNTLAAWLRASCGTGGAGLGGFQAFQRTYL